MERLRRKADLQVVCGCEIEGICQSQAGVQVHLPSLALVRVCRLASLSNLAAHAGHLCRSDRLKLWNLNVYHLHVKVTLSVYMQLAFFPTPHAIVVIGNIIRCKYCCNLPCSSLEVDVLL